MKPLIPPLIFLFFFLGGCVQQGIPNTSAQCDEPYAFVNRACCLDKNANRICDIDETQRAQVIVREKPLVLVQELCNLPRFSCESKKITRNFIKLDLKLERDEIITLQKITLSPIQCFQELNTTLHRGERIQITIPCPIEDEVISSEASIDATIQPILRYSNGQIYEYGIITPALLKGEIAGIVR